MAAAAAGGSSGGSPNRLAGCAAAEDEVTHLPTGLGSTPQAMHPRRAAAYTALAFLCLFCVQVLWTQGRLDQLRQLGRRGLRTTTRGGGAATTQKAAGGSTQTAADGSTHLDTLALHGVRPDGSATGGVGGAEGRPLMADPALIVFCFNRSDYLNQTLHSLLGLRGLDRYTVYVSQVGVPPGVLGVCAEHAGVLLLGGVSPVLRPVHDRCHRRRMVTQSRWRRLPGRWRPPSCAQPAALSSGRRRRGCRR